MNHPQDLKLPPHFQLNAYDPDAAASASGPVSPDADLWALRYRPETLTFLASEEPPDLRDWSDPRVGWGLIVPENPTCTGRDSAELSDYAGDPIIDLWTARGRGPVFRYDPSRNDRLVVIRSARDGEDTLLRAGPPGAGPKCLPRYLLIYGGPEEIPWDLQYALHQNRNCFVGRIPFRGSAAANYVRAAVSGFEGCPARKSSALIWAPVWPEEGELGITRLMRDAIASPVFQRMTADRELTPVFVDGVKQRATVNRLFDELASHNPAMIITTSHGQTGPLHDEKAMAGALGLPLDEARVAAEPTDLLEAWNPGGAVWYSHACCSAGSDAKTNFDKLLIPDSTPDRILRAIAKLDSRVAPLPLALLQAPSPVRAFIGHIEPTFDFSLRYPGPMIPTTDSLQAALYDGLYRAKPEPVGMALRGWYDRIGEMLGLFNESLKDYNKGSDVEMTPTMIWSLLAANDIKTTVILGDPAMTLPG